jgi:hypothetical protein
MEKNINRINEDRSGIFSEEPSNNNDNRVSNSGLILPSNKLSS